ncbi:MAG: hypothetical protein IPL32_12630 [Chloracidobacterium sp.]|nr:hypothetical protein [Chloracidobacterium sp.]
MNNRKNQNSLLVLATLGVYLGLVLAGATPQVLAQAATAKQFNVKDEIEVKDNLDNKPDDKPYTEIEKAGVRFVGLYIEGLIRSLDAFTYAESKGYNLSYNIKTADIFDSGFDNPFAQINKNITAGFLDQRIDDNGLYFRFSLKWNQGEHGTSELFSAVDSGRSVFARRPNAFKEKLLIKNSSVSSVNDQVFIVTRLPRAGLDSLLASDAK